jgi:hypothetical protein
MRKLLILLALGSSFAAGAQVSIGPEVGLNISSISGAANTYTNRSGPRFGLSADVKIADNLYLQPGLFYSSKGGHTTNETNQNLSQLAGLSGLGNILDSLGNISQFTTLTATENITYSINYLQLPVMVVYKFKAGNSGNFFAGVGPYVSWAMDGNYKRSLVSGIAGQSITTNESRAIEKGKDINAIDFGLNVNAGYIHNSGFFCRGFYEMGITDNGVGKNVSFGLSMGYYFNSEKGDK